jgi:hypothetical protein
MMFERRNMVVRRRFGEYEEEEVLARVVTQVN